MRKKHMRLVTVLSAWVVLATACTPVLVTQPQRFEYLKQRIDDNARRAMDCQEFKFTFQATEKKGLEWHDLYLVEGCDQRSEYITIIRQDGTGAHTWTTWSFGLVPTEGDYVRAAKEQLKKTAQFDTDCEELEFTMLHALLTHPRNAFEATIGVRGCGKKNTYQSRCQHVAYTAGKHDISCSSVITSADGKAVRTTEN